MTINSTFKCKRMRGEQSYRTCLMRQARNLKTKNFWLICMPIEGRKQCRGQEIIEKFKEEFEAIKNAPPKTYGRPLPAGVGNHEKHKSWEKEVVKSGT